MIESDQAFICLLEYELSEKWTLAGLAGSISASVMRDFVRFKTRPERLPESTGTPCQDGNSNVR